MSTLSSANVTDVNLVLKERTHNVMRLCLNMLIFTHNFIVDRLGRDSIIIYLYISGLGACAFFYEVIK